MSKSASKQNYKKYEYFPYEVVISVESGENPVQLRDTTLSLCKLYKIPANKITVLLAEKSQESRFQHTLLPGTFGRILSGRCEFSEGTPLIYMNSCITGFYEYSEKGPKPLKSLLEMIKTGFQECQKSGSFLWSIRNKKDLKPTVNYSLKPITNAFFGCIFTGIDNHLSARDEIERSILYYKLTGKIVRLNMFGVVSCIKPQMDEEMYKRLKKQYPEFVHFVSKHGILILKLVDIKAHT